MPTALETFRSSITTAVGETNPEALQAVVAAKKKEEVERKAALITQGLAALDTAEKALAQIKPDMNSFSSTGEAAEARYSAGAWQKKQAATTTLNKLSAALELAISQSKYEDLAKLLASKPSADKGQSVDVTA